MKQTFEDYLKEVQKKNCPERDFEYWLSQKDVEEIMDLAEIWGREQYEKGEVACLIAKDQVELDVTNQLNEETKK